MNAHEMGPICYCGDPFCEGCCDDAIPQLEDGDIVVMPTGQLGSWYAISLYGERWLANVKTDAEADAFILDYMNRHQFYPNVWNISDHGNTSLRLLDGNA